MNYDDQSNTEFADAGHKVRPRPPRDSRGEVQDFVRGSVRVRGPLHYGVIFSEGKFKIVPPMRRKKSD